MPEVSIVHQLVFFSPKLLPEPNAEMYSVFFFSLLLHPLWWVNYAALLLSLVYLVFVRSLDWPFDFAEMKASHFFLRVGRAAIR